MHDPQPTGDFQWLTSSELQAMEREYWENNGDSIPAFGEVGYVLECDLEYSDHMKLFFADYPPLCEKRTVSLNELSPHTQNLGESYGICTSGIGKTPKLIADLSNKIRYKLHYRNLALLLQIGVKLLRIRSGIRFKQSTFLRSYIDLNTELRKSSTDNFSKTFYKLLNNS